MPDANIGQGSARACKPESYLAARSVGEMMADIAGRTPIDNGLGTGWLPRPSAAFRARPGLPRFSLRALLPLLLLLLACLPPPASAAGTPRQTGMEIITAGSEIDFPPYAITDSQGQADGFSVELLQAVAEAMDLRVSFRTGQWNTVWEALKRGEIDALPLVARSAERAEHAEFAAPHTVTYDSFFVRSGTPPLKSLAEADGKEIVVMRGDTAHEELVRRGFHGRLILVASIPEAMRLLASGSHHAVLVSKLIGHMVLRDTKLDGVIVSGPPLRDYRREFAFAVKKGNIALKERLEQGIAIVKATGRYDEIYGKWLGTLEPPQIKIETLAWWLGIPSGVALVIFAWALSLRREIRLRLRQELRLRESEERLAAAVRAGKLGVHDFDPQTGRLQWDRAVYLLWGVPEGEPVNRETFEAGVHPEDLDAVKASVARALDPSDTRRYECEFRVVNRSDGSVRWVFADGDVTFRNGCPVRLVGTVQDITARKEGEAALRATTHSLQAALDVAAMAPWSWDLAGGVIQWTPRVKAMLGVPADSRPTKEMFVGLLHPDDVRRFEEAWALAMDPAGSHTYQLEYRIRRASDGAQRWISSKGTVDFEGERPVRITGAVRDVTGERHAQDDLRASEERLHAIVDTAVDAIVVIDKDGIVQSANPATERIFGYAPGEIVGRSVSVLMPEPYGSAHAGYVSTYLRTGEAHVIGLGREVDARRKDGTLFPADLAIAEWQAGGKRYFTALMRDISERRKRDEQVQLLLREVNHRAKNMLSVVQAIASQTAACGREEFIARFQERIQALAANQDLLVRSQWQNVGLEDLVRAQLAHFEGFIGRRISVAGPALPIAAEAAQPIAMALHELATNAGKYGALSNDAGAVKIAWDIEGTGAGARFYMSWAESGGPAVAAPHQCGFGTKVITQVPHSQLDAEVTYEFLPSGVLWCLSCPAQNVLEHGWTEAGSQVPA